MASNSIVFRLLPNTPEPKLKQIDADFLKKMFHTPITFFSKRIKSIHNRTTDPQFELLHRAGFLYDTASLKNWK